MKTVLIYVNTSKEVGDIDHLQTVRQRGSRRKMVQGKRSLKTGTIPEVLN